VNLSNFFDELKRRNRYKVGVAYAVIAWLLLEAGSIFSASTRCAVMKISSSSSSRFPWR
jgi:hypothetical protein